MPGETLCGYQIRGIASIVEWYRRVAAPGVTLEQDSSVRSFLLWTSLNAL
jgi:hypothetical protein